MASLGPFGTTGEGGTIIGMRRSIIDRLNEHITKVHRRGRAVTQSAQTSRWAQFTSMHTVVAEPMPARNRLLSSINA